VTLTLTVTFSPVQRCVSTKLKFLRISYFEKIGGTGRTGGQADGQTDGRGAHLMRPLSRWPHNKHMFIYWEAISDATIYDYATSCGLEQCSEFYTTVDVVGKILTVVVIDCWRTDDIRRFIRNSLQTAGWNAYSMANAACDKQVICVDRARSTSVYDERRDWPS